MSFDRPAGGNPDLKRLLSRHRDAAADRHAARPRADQVVLPPVRHAGPLAGRQALDRSRAAGRVNDGVTTIIIGSNDYAGAWAVDQRGRGIMPVTPGGETQREMSFRVGVNLVMHALTGNYKDDQVHIQDIMQRLRR